MTADVVVTLPAGDDIDAILSFLRSHAGQSVADAYRLNLRAAFQRLADHPQIAPARPALGRGVRLITVKPYVVLHRYDRATDTVSVLRVLHGRPRLALDAT